MADIELRRDALRRAIKEAGGQAELAQALSRPGHPIRQSHVSNWLNRDQQVTPAEHCIAIEQACKGVVTRYELREDIFGPDPNLAKSKRKAA